MRAPSGNLLAGAVIRGWQASQDCRCDAATPHDDISFTKPTRLMFPESAAAAAAGPAVSWDKQQQVHHQLLFLRLGTQQMQQQQHEQRLPPLPLAVLLSHRQSSLLHCLPLQHQPPCRNIYTSTYQENKWRPVPRLHQPSQHIQGTDPLRTPKVPSNPMPDAGVTQNAAAAAADPAAAAAADPAAASSTAGDSWHRRFRAATSSWRTSVAGAQYLINAALALGVCITVYLVLQTVILYSSQGSLQSKDPVAVSSAVRSLRWLMSHDLAVRFAEKGLIPDLVALIQPGTDAITLNHVFSLLDQLLGYGGEVRETVLQSNLLEALNDGLQKGWLPRGAADAAYALLRRMQKLQQRRLPAVKA